jgi:hypothetical protein
MSWHVYLYRAAAGHGSMNGWEQMHAEPLGTADELKARLAELLPDVRWSPVDVPGTRGWSGLGSNALDAPYVDVQVLEHEPSCCRFVTLNKPDVATRRRIMRELGLNHACVPESGELLEAP